MHYTRHWSVMTTYKIVRKYASSELEDEVIKTGLSLEEAQAHCQDPETSSKTCCVRAHVLLTDRVGAWFDCYYEEH